MFDICSIYVSPILYTVTNAQFTTLLHNKGDMADEDRNGEFNARVYQFKLFLSLMFTGISNAEFDLKTVAGMWFFDEGKGDTAADCL